jgi:hypothetical protein
VSASSLHHGCNIPHHACIITTLSQSPALHSTAASSIHPPFILYHPLSSSIILYSSCTHPLPSSSSSIILYSSSIHPLLILVSSSFILFIRVCQDCLLSSPLPLLVPFLFSAASPGSQPLPALSRLWSQLLSGLSSSLDATALVPPRSLVSAVPWSQTTLSLSRPPGLSRSLDSAAFWTQPLSGLRRFLDSAALWTQPLSGLSRCLDSTTR